MKPMFERRHYDAMAALIQKIPDPQARILTGLHFIRELESQPNFKPFPICFCGWLLKTDCGWRRWALIPTLGGEPSLTNGLGLSRSLW